MGKLTITVCGCGNGAHACAALMGLKGHTVNIYSPLTDEICRFKKAYEENRGLTMRFGGGLLSGLYNAQTQIPASAETHEGIQIDKISSDAAEVIPQASIIFIITPAFAHGSILRAIKPYLRESSLLVFLPGRGGLEFEMRSIVPHARAVAFQTLPWAARTYSFGKEVFISARKRSILAASFPADLSDLFFYQLECLLEMEVVRAKHIFTMTLANVGQIFHPGIMYSIFRDDPHKRYPADQLPLFYQGIDEEGGVRLSKMSDEIRAVAAAAATLNPDIEPDKVLHVKDWLSCSYAGEMEDTSSLYGMLVTNKAYSGLRAPMKETGDGMYAPDFSVRYIVEDIPYGLLITKSVGRMLGAETPTVDEVLSGIDAWTGNDYLGRLESAGSLAKDSRVPELYGIRDIQDILG